MQCPKCQGEILDKGAFFACEKVDNVKEGEQWVNKGDCDFMVWKSCFAKFQGEPLDIETLEEIYTNGEAEIDLISKSGKPYKAFAIPDDKYFVKIDFDRFNKEDKA